MTCRRAFEVDLAELLHGGDDPAAVAFRDHYPRCAACAAEVRAWTEVHARLVDGAATHPAPERLLLLADRPDALPADERRALERHVGGCRSCRDEVTTLARLDLQRILGTAEIEGRALRAMAPAPVRTARRPATPSRRPGVLAGLRRVATHPGFAYALVVLALAPLLYSRLASSPDLRPLSREPAALRGSESTREADEHGPPGDDVALEPPPAAQAPAATPPSPPADRDDAHAVASSGARARDNRADTKAPARVEPRRELAKRAPATSEGRPDAAPGAAGSPAPAPPPPPADALRERGLADAPAAADTGRAAGGMARTRQPEVAGTLAAKPAEPAAAEIRLDGAAEARIARPTGDTAAVTLAGAPAGDLDVRFATADGRRELRQRVASPGGDVHTTVPIAWLLPGEYRVEVRSDGAIVRYRLRVTP